MSVFTVRDAKFFSFVDSLTEQARHASEKLSSFPVSINAEIGYGGARLMDVRWTGFGSISKLCQCLFYCSSDNIKLRLVGSSAGNIVVFSLAVVLGIKGVCCGYDVRYPKKRGASLRRDLFLRATGLKIPDDVDCACECVRRIADLLLEAVAVQEHPAWPGHTKLLPVHLIKDLFEGRETAESILAFGRGTAASGYSDLYMESPVQYVLNMYRALDGLEGRVGALYLLSRFVIMFCTTWSIDAAVNPLQGRCEMYIGSRKISGDEGFMFTELVDTDLIPLIRLPFGDASIFKDANIFNRGVDVLMDSIDVREIVFPRIAEVLWRREMKRMRLRTDTTLTDIENWRWSSRVSSPRSFSRRDFETVDHHQVSADIMTNNQDSHLPDFEAMILKSVSPPRPLCWNYVFEISPQGKHLFPLERVSALFEASLPLITPWQLCRKESACPHPTPLQRKLSLLAHPPL